VFKALALRGCRKIGLTWRNHLDKHLIKAKETICIILDECNEIRNPVISDASGYRIKSGMTIWESFSEEPRQSTTGLK